MSDQAAVTQILENATRGDRRAVDELFPVVYDELRRLAQSVLLDERPDHTLQATALVHEAYVKLVDQTRAPWQNRAHFFAVAAQAIRRILVDHARGRGRKKRGGGAVNVSLDEALNIAGAPPATDTLALDRALQQLALEHATKVEVVNMRFFAGMTSREVAEVLGVTERTVERHWQFARAWLYRELAGAEALGDSKSD